MYLRMLLENILYQEYNTIDEKVRIYANYNIK